MCQVPDPSSRRQDCLDQEKGAVAREFSCLGCDNKFASLEDFKAHLQPFGNFFEEKWKELLVGGESPMRFPIKPK